jgi:hypothetical protein
MFAGISGSKTLAQLVSDVFGTGASLPTGKNVGLFVDLAHRN